MKLRIFICFFVFPLYMCYDPDDTFAAAREYTLESSQYRDRVLDKFEAHCEESSSIADEIRIKGRDISEEMYNSRTEEYDELKRLDELRGQLKAAYGLVDYDTLNN